MNGKKAKAIRRLAKQQGFLKTEPEYRVQEVKKMVYFTDKDGKSQAQQVSRHTIINMSKIAYRQMKQAYVNGELAI